MRLGSPAQKVMKHRKGLWSPEEDEKLSHYVLKHGHGSWSSVPVQIGLERSGKSCRLRWLNYLRPGLKRGAFSRNEEETILSLHRNLGNKWAQIAQRLPGRTDSEIKNHWHTHLKKQSLRTAAAEITESQEINSLSWNVSSFSAFGTSPNPISNHRNSNGYWKEGLRGSLPKLLFEEWLSIGKLNDHNYRLPSAMEFDHPFADQVCNVFEDTFLNNEFLSSPEYYCDGMNIAIFPDLELVDHSPPGQVFSIFECSFDHAIRSGLGQMYSS